MRHANVNLAIEDSMREASVSFIRHAMLDRDCHHWYGAQSREMCVYGEASIAHAARARFGIGEANMASPDSRP